jgi:antitoxin (DNA-binding transcriptional repressor) of toxin-antitoxin stability system
MATITLEQAQRALAELIRGLAPGEEVVITEDDRPLPASSPPPHRPGTPPLAAWARCAGRSSTWRRTSTPRWMTSRLIRSDVRP